MYFFFLFGCFSSSWSGFLSLDFGLSIFEFGFWLLVILELGFWILVLGSYVFVGGWILDPKSKNKTPKSKSNIYRRCQKVQKVYNGQRKRVYNG